MRLIDGVQQFNGCPAEIPDCSRDGLPEFFIQMGYKVGAEIGVYKGGYTEQLCKVGLKIYAIDPWLPNTDNRGKERQDSLHESTIERLKPYDCAVLRRTSEYSLQFFTNNSLDFVYIDGDHTFKSIAHDIYEWEKRVRPGGIISGHDYFNSIPGDGTANVHVKSIVDAYVEAFAIKNWYIFGKLNNPISPDDNFYSWMWVKE
jgi:hypothetical protein